MSDTLNELIRSTIDLYRRFEVSPQPPATIRTFQEEAAELIEAAQQGTNPAHIAEEAADVMVTAIGICLSCGIDPQNIIAQAQKVITKNDSKTHHTHAINEHGKIARKTGELPT